MFSLLNPYKWYAIGAVVIVLAVTFGVMKLEITHLRHDRDAIKAEYEGYKAIQKAEEEKRQAAAKAITNKHREVLGSIKRSTEAKVKQEVVEIEKHKELASIPLADDVISLYNSSTVQGGTTGPE